MTPWRTKPKDSTLCLFGLVLLLFFTSARAHELPNNRLTLVLRNEHHLAITYFIDYPQALHQALAPQKTMPEFAIMHSTMSAAEFQKVLLKAQLSFIAGTKIVMPNGDPLKVSHWRWPEPAKVQALLQKQIMKAVVAANEHEHEEPIEIQAHATSVHKITSVAISMPIAFGTTTVVSYQPKQILVGPKAMNTVIKF